MFRKGNLKRESVVYISMTEKILGNTLFFKKGINGLKFESKYWISKNFWPYLLQYRNVVEFYNINICI